MKTNLNQNMENWSSKAKFIWKEGMASAMKIKMGHTRYQEGSCQNLFFMNSLVGCFENNLEFQDAVIPDYKLNIYL